MYPKSCLWAHQRVAGSNTDAELLIILLEETDKVLDIILGRIKRGLADIFSWLSLYLRNQFRFWDQLS